MNIQPTTSVNNPLGGEVNRLEITVNSFTLFPSSINITWKVTGQSVSKEGILTLPQSIVDQWGTDDTIVKNYVLAQLQLVEEVTTTTTTEVPIETTTTETPVETTTTEMPIETTTTIEPPIE